MRGAGISEFILHARYGLTTPYLSEAWFDAVSAVLAEAERTGMRAWIYDELNWPSGMAGGLVTTERRLIEHRLGDDDALLPPSVDPFYSPDYLTPESAELFLSSTHEEYLRRFGRYFGSTVPGFFNDEIRFAHARPWSPRLGPPPKERTGYLRTISDMFRETHVRKISEWCASHGVKLIGHVMGEETLGSQVRYVGDILKMLSLFHEPGCDHLGISAEGLQADAPASAAYFNGHPAVTCETGGGIPWDFTIGDLYRISGWLFATGVTRVILHGFFYNENPSEWPPDMFFRWKGWDRMKEYVRWAERIQYFLSRCRPVCRVAVYHPFEEFIASYEPDTNFTLNFPKSGSVRGGSALRLHEQIQGICRCLRSRHIPYVLLPEAWFDRADGMVLVHPEGTNPDWHGPSVKADGNNAGDWLTGLDRLLGDRVRIIGPDAEMRVRPSEPFIRDPYIHDSGDDAGMLIREFVLDGQTPCLLVWNANPQGFEGEIRGASAYSRLWDPATDLAESWTGRPKLSLPGFSMAVLIG
jgi:hypothetical protein